MFNLCRDILKKYKLNTAYIFKNEKSFLKSDLTNNVGKEMSIFLKKKFKANILRCICIFNYFKTVIPTSVESERAFSPTAFMCIKIGSQINNKSLDKINFS